MSDSLEHILACQICLEDFEESGEKVPRILPCSHTLCERCLRRLIRWNFIECPECRKKHRVVNNARTFPQNKYILTNIRRKLAAAVRNEAEEAVGQLAKCEEHNKDLILFCKGPDCQKAICQRCLTKYHRGHDVVDVEEEDKEVLGAKLESETQNLLRKKDNIFAAKVEVEEKNEACIAKLQAAKGEHLRKINQMYDEMINDVTSKMEEASAVINEELVTIDEHLELLNNIKGNLNNDAATHEELTNGIETVSGISESVSLHLSGTRRYKFSEYQENQISDTEMVLLGRVEPNEAACELSGEALEEVQEVTRPLMETRNYEVTNNLRQYAVDFICTVTHSICTNYSEVSFLSPLGCNTAVLLGKVNDVRKLTQYNLLTGGEVCHAVLNDDARSITEVILAGDLCVAVSYWVAERIEFRNATNLSQVLLNHLVTPQKPFYQCTASPTALVYEDWSEDRHEVRQLDCSRTPPAAARGNILGRDFVRDICFIQHQDKQLLISTRTSDEVSEVHAHNTVTNSVEWRVLGKLPGMNRALHPLGITTDGRGHLFVCDVENKCIQMFSAGGRYMGVLLREGEQGLGEPRRIRWCENMSSLIVSNMKDDKWNISVINVQ